MNKPGLKTRIDNSKNKGIYIVIVLLVFDIAGIYLSFLLASEFRRLLIPWIGGSVYWPAYQNIVLLGIVSVVGMLMFAGLYPGYGLTAVVELERITKSLTLVYLFLGIAIYFLGSEFEFPRSIFLFAWIQSIAIVSLLRLILRNRLSLTKAYGIPVLFIIQDQEDRAAILSVYRCRRMGWNIAGVYVYGSIDHQDPIDGIPLVYSWDEMVNIKQKRNINTVIISNPILKIKENNQISMLRNLTSIFNKVVIVIPELNLGSVWVKPRDLEGYLGLEVNYQLLIPAKRVIKAGTDYLGGLILLVIFLPLILLISIILYLDDPGPVFYRQDRLGRNFNIFQTYKFRSMEINAEQKLTELLEKDPAAKDEYRLYRKLMNDPRTTRVGRFLRKYSLDEIPQILNVVRGEMSLVGPRAYIPGELVDHQGYAKLILKVRPGMTGWWQVTGRNELTFQGRLSRDEYYLSNWSLWLDFYILVRTVLVVVSGKGQ